MCSETATTPSTPRHSCSITGIRSLTSTDPPRTTCPSRTSTVTSEAAGPSVPRSTSPVISSRMASSRRRKIISRSPRLTMPCSRSASSTTGSRLTFCTAMRRAASTTVHSGRAHTAGADISSSALAPSALARSHASMCGTGVRPDRSAWAEDLRSRSASDTTPTGRSRSSTTGTAVTPLSASSWTISLNGMSRCARTTLRVMSSATVRWCMSPLRSRWRQSVGSGGRCQEGREPLARGC